MIVSLFVSWAVYGRRGRTSETVIRALHIICCYKSCILIKENRNGLVIIPVRDSNYCFCFSQVRYGGSDDRLWLKMYDACDQ